MRSLNRLSFSSLLNPPKSLDHANDSLRIGGAVLELPLDEADREVNPAVMDLSVFIKGETNINGTFTASYTPATGVFTVLSGGTSNSVCIWRRYSPSPLNLSNISVIRLGVIGTGSGNSYNIMFCSDDAGNAYGGVVNYATYSFVDDFVGERTFVWVKSSPTASGGSINWTSIYRVRIDVIPAVTETMTFSRFVLCDGVPAQDHSGNGNHGTAAGTQIVHSKWVEKNARSFNGLGDRITIADNPALRLFPVTFGALVNRDASQTDDIGAVISKVRNYQLLLHKNGTVLVTYDSEGYRSSQTSSGTVPAGQWCWVVATYQASGADTLVKIYVGGVKVKEETLTTQPYAGFSAVLTVGAYSATLQRFKGDIAATFLSNRVLSDAEIALLSDSVCYPDVYSEQGVICLRGRVVDGNGLNKRIDHLKGA